MNKQVVTVAVKEFLRLVVFAIPGILIQVFTKNPELSVGYGGMILGALKAIDRAIHDNPDSSVNGLLPF